MTHTVRGWMAGLAAVGVLAASAARSDVLTADRAVQLALQKNSSVIGANAAVLDARSGLYGAYSRMLPSVSASLTRGGSRSTGTEGNRLFGTILTPTSRTDDESYSTTPSLNGSWSVLDLSALQSVQSARTGMRASQLRRSGTRQEVAFSTRRQFYEVVRAVRLADVAASALRLARDDERRVRALFEVGSVSRSDLLKARVRGAQSQLDSLNASQAVTNQRIALAQILGLAEGEMGEVDTALTAVPVTVDEAAVRLEAAAARPDLKAADAERHAARAGLRAANLARLPAVSVNGSLSLNTKSTFSQKIFGTSGTTRASARSNTDRQWQASIALDLPLFTGLATESQIASAQARVQRADDARDALWRNLDAEVHQAVLQHGQAVAQAEVARQAVESAQENLKLTQQKYNVGSSTILDLIDAQVQLQRAQSDAVSALAGIRVAEAQIDRVRGRSE